MPCLDTACTQDLTIFLGGLCRMIPEQQKIFSLEKILNRTDDQITSNVLSFMLLLYKNYMTTTLLEKLVAHPKSDISICEQLLHYPSTDINSKILIMLVQRTDITPTIIHRVLRNVSYSNAPITARASILKALSYNKKVNEYNLSEQLDYELSAIQAIIQETLANIIRATTMLTQLSISKEACARNIPIEINQKILSFAYKTDVLDMAAKITQTIQKNRAAKYTL